MKSRRRAALVLAAFLFLSGLTVISASSVSAMPVSAVSEVRSLPTIPGIPDCKEAPLPEQPGMGLPGAVDPEPDPLPAPADPFGPNPSTSVYDQYGYAGLTWHTYDLGCGGSVRDPAASMDTSIGNVLLSGAVWLTASTNGLHNRVADPASYMGPVDQVVGTVTDRLHDAIWSPWGGVALMGVAAMLLFQAMRGHFPAVVAGAAWAALVLAVVAAITQYPSRASGFFDDTITSSIGTVQARTAGIESSTSPGQGSARAQGALTVDRVLYDAWLRGQLGSSDSEAARRWGPSLFQASATTWSDAAAASTPEAAKGLVEEKAQEWTDTTEEIADQDPATYAIVQGKAGGRMGAGAMALFGAVFVDLFRLVADVFLLAGLVMLRLLVMFLPAAAVIGVFAPLSGIVKQMANIGGAAVVNVVAFSAGSVVHAAAITAILSTATDAGMGVMALVLCAVITLAAFVLMAPLLSFTRVFGHPGRRVRRHRLSRQFTRYVATRQGVNDGTKRAIENVTDQEPERTVPEEEATRRSASAPPRAETFGRDNVVWDVTSDGGLSQSRVVPAKRVGHGPREVKSQQVMGAGSQPPTPVQDRPLRATTYAVLGSEDGAAGSRLSESDGVRDVPLVSLQRPASRVITGAVLADRVDPASHMQVGRTHDGNAQVAGDGLGYFVYDPESGAMLRWPSEGQSKSAEAS